MTKEQYEEYTLLNINVQQLKKVEQYVENITHDKCIGILNVALDECERTLKEEMEKI